MCVDLNKLSTGISNFEDLILKNKIYVDKTKVIKQWRKPHSLLWGCKPQNALYKDK